jgi:trimeric autotransporter adhesin
VTGNTVYVSSKGQLGVVVSSERYKSDFADMGARSAKLRQLRPVTFHLKTDPKGAVQYGLIAGEVAKVYPELVIPGAGGRIDGARYDELAPILLNEVKQQRQRTTHDQKLAAQASRVAYMEELLASLQIQAKASQVAIR